MPYGEVGNSEVGHMSIGAGMIPFQSLHRINEAIRTGELRNNERFQKAIERVKERESTLHFIGLLSNGGVHSLDKHLYALLEIARDAGVTDIVVHAILDGRDTGPKTAEQFVQELMNKFREIGVGRIGSLCGRYWAMDRDHRWDRTERAYRAIVDALGTQSSDPMTAIERSYANNIFDEEFEPTVIRGYQGMKDGDSIVTWNFRPDRMRQITESLVNNGFGAFMVTPLHLQVVTMTDYDSKVRVSGVMFPSVSVKQPLARILSDVGLAQIHIAETEKYAHVTYFLNGGREEPFPNEQRVMIPSPKIPYDQQPEMSASKVCDAAVSAMKKNEFAFLAVNFANADMVGHTGRLDATIRAVETLDEQVGRLVKSVLAHNGAVIITADHGNAEEMINIHTGSINKEHTTNPVPVYIISKPYDGKGVGLRDLSQDTPSGVLADVAPTVLEMLGLPKSESMRGNSLLSLIS